VKKDGPRETVIMRGVNEREEHAVSGARERKRGEGAHKS
jgi:hypothetical protein